MPLISTLAGTASRAYGFLAKSISLFGSYLSAGNTGGGFVFSSDASLYSQIGNSGTTNTTIAKYNLSGGVDWQKQISTSVNVGLTNSSLAMDSSNNLYVLASSDTENWLGKFNSTGTLQWQRVIDDTQAATRLLQKSNVSWYSTYNNIYSYNSSGTIDKKWTLTDGAVFLGITDLAHDGSNLYVGGVLRTGTSYGYGIAKVNSSGSVVWTTDTYTGFDSGIKLALDTSGNVYLAGGVGSTGYMHLVKFNSSGTLQWQKQIELSSYTSAQALYVDDVENTIYLGTLDSLVFKFDLSGNILWQYSAIATYGNKITNFYTDNTFVYIGGIAGFLAGSNKGATVLAINKSGIEDRTLSVNGSTYSWIGQSFTVSNSSLATSTTNTYTVTTPSRTDTAGSWTVGSGSATLYYASK